MFKDIVQLYPEERLFATDLRQDAGYGVQR